MNNPFTPSTKYPPVCYGADPAKYHSLGKSAGRGKPDFVMSRSELMRFNRNPWKWVRGSEDGETDAMEWGSLCDTLALTPELFASRYEVCPETYPASGMKCPTCGSVTDSQKCAKCKCERFKTTTEQPWNWNAEHCSTWKEKVLKAGKVPLKSTALTSAKEAVARLMSDERIARLFEVSKKQVQVVAEYRDADTGITVHIKALLDLLPDPLDAEYGRLLPDMKTCANAEIGAWEKHVFTFHYHTQGGMYLDVTNAALGTNYDGFIHVVQESEAPYAVARRMLSDEFLTLGRETYQSALKRYCRCLAANEWPSYDDEDDKPGNPLLDGWRITNPSAWMVGV